MYALDAGSEAENDSNKSGSKSLNIRGHFKGPVFNCDCKFGINTGINQLEPKGLH